MQAEARGLGPTLHTPTPVSGKQYKISGLARPDLHIRFLDGQKWSTLCYIGLLYPKPQFASNYLGDLELEFIYEMHRALGTNGPDPLTCLCILNCSVWLIIGIHYSALAGSSPGHTTGALTPGVFKTCLVVYVQHLQLPQWPVHQLMKKLGLTCMFISSNLQLFSGGTLSKIITKINLYKPDG